MKYKVFKEHQVLQFEYLYALFNAYQICISTYRIISSIFIFYLHFYIIYAAGVAIMVCAGTAATRWARRGWPINDNPVSEVYKLLWRVFEPMLFTLSGYYLDVRVYVVLVFAVRDISVETLYNYQKFK